MSLIPINIGDAVLYNADCRDVLASLPDNSVDSIVTDPPYEIGFMGKGWDGSGIAYNVDMWREAMRVLKPGGHLLAFSSTRTYHRMVCAIEDAGFEIRDQIGWLYGQGFPKNLDVSKAIDKAAGADRVEVERKNVGNGNGRGEGFRHDGDKSGVPVTAPTTDDAKKWEGWGTALKPAQEPICVARKPLAGTVVENVLAHGTGALNIDGCRVGTDDTLSRKNNGRANEKYNSGNWQAGVFGSGDAAGGRWPANIIHDGSEEVLAAFPDAKGQQGDLVDHGNCRQSPSGIFGGIRPAMDHPARIESETSAARFFYCAKPSPGERDEGLESLAKRQAGLTSNTSGQHITRRDDGYEVAPRANYHPTVKPIALGRYLQRLVTPPGGVTMDLFMGSASFGVSAIFEGFKYIGCEADTEHGYFNNIAIPRITWAVAIPQQQEMFA